MRSYSNSLIVFGLMLVAGAATGSEPLAQELPTINRPKRIAIFLDTSGSMAGPRASAMKEGAKLAVAIFDREQVVRVIKIIDVPMIEIIDGNAAA